MTDQKLTDLAPTLTAADSDLALVTLDPAGSPDSRSMAMSDFLRLSEGNLSLTGGAANQVLSATTWTKITQFDTAESVTAVTADHTDDSILLPDTGRYLATLDVGGDFSISDELRFRIYWNSVAQGVYVPVQWDTSDRSAHVTVPLNVSVASMKVEAYVYSVTGGTFAAKEMLLNVVRTG